MANSLKWLEEWLLEFQVQWLDLQIHTFLDKLFDVLVQIFGFQPRLMLRSSSFGSCWFLFGLKFVMTQELLRIAENATLRSQESVMAEIHELKPRLKLLGVTCEDDKAHIGTLSRAISTTNYLDKKGQKTPYSAVT